MLPLLFLSQAPPLYLLLFLTATYLLQRPCLYCTLLLFLIIITLFDFQSNWFGDAAQSATGTSESRCNDTSTISDTLKASATLASSVLNETAAVALDLATGRLQRLAGGRWSWGRTGLEWLKDIAQRRELRINCINTVIRL